MKARLIYFVICLTLINCKEPQPEITFEYSDQPVVINCDINNSELFNEAFYNFEHILIENYPNKNPNLSSAYRQFLIESTNKAVNYNNISNQHSLDVFEALKNIEGLWITENNELSPNYKHEIFSCIGDNIKDKDIRDTYNALLSTNSMSIRMLKDVFISNSAKFNREKYLATFVALELYYSKLSNVDLSLKQETPSDLKPNTATDPHAGHNHD